MTGKSVLGLLLLVLIPESQASIFGFTNWFAPFYQQQTSNQFQYMQDGRRQRNQFSNAPPPEVAKSVNILNFQILPDGDEDSICRRPSRIQNYYNKIIGNKDNSLIKSNQAISTPPRQSRYSNEDKVKEEVEYPQMESIQKTNSNDQNKAVVNSKKNMDNQENTRIQPPSNSQTRGGTSVGPSNLQMKGGQSNNIVQGSDNKLNGLQNTIQGNKNMMIGIGNNLLGDSNKILGTSNGIIGNQNAAAGNSNGIAGNANVVVGSNNGVFGSENQIQGNSNGIWAGKSIIRGNNNIIKS